MEVSENRISLSVSKTEILVLFYHFLVNSDFLPFFGYQLHDLFSSNFVMLNLDFLSLFLTKEYIGRKRFSWGLLRNINFQFLLLDVQSELGGVFNLPQVSLGALLKWLNGLGLLLLMRVNNVFHLVVRNLYVVRNRSDVCHLTYWFWSWCDMISENWLECNNERLIKFGITCLDIRNGCCWFLLRRYFLKLGCQRFWLLILLTATHFDYCKANNIFWY